MEPKQAEPTKAQLQTALRILGAMDGVLEEAVAALWKEVLWKLDPDHFPEAEGIVEANVKRKRWLFPLLQDAINPDRPPVQLGDLTSLGEILGYAKDYYAEHGYDGNPPDPEDPNTDKPNFKHM